MGTGAGKKGGDRGEKGGGGEILNCDLKDWVKWPTLWERHFM